ncbi:hypothetical protein AB9E28_35120, partial [Rhizobium leguminosarum]
IRGVLPQASTISFPFTVREIVRMCLTSGLNLHPDKAEQTAAAALSAVDDRLGDLAEHAGKLHTMLLASGEFLIETAFEAGQID